MAALAARAAPPPPAGSGTPTRPARCRAASRSPDAGHAHRARERAEVGVDAGRRRARTTITRPLWYVETSSELPSSSSSVARLCGVDAAQARWSCATALRGDRGARRDWAPSGAPVGVSTGATGRIRGGSAKTSWARSATGARGPTPGRARRRCASTCRGAGESSVWRESGSRSPRSTSQPGRGARRAGRSRPAGRRPAGRSSRRTSARAGAPRGRRAAWWWSPPTAAPTTSASGSPIRSRQPGVEQQRPLRLRPAGQVRIGDEAPRPPGVEHRADRLAGVAVEVHEGGVGERLGEERHPQRVLRGLLEEAERLHRRRDARRCGRVRRPRTEVERCRRSRAWRRRR